MTYVEEERGTMTTAIVPERELPPAIIPAQADTDAQLVALWLHGRSPRTQCAYAADVQRLLTFVAKPMAAITLGDLQAFADSLGHLAPASQGRTLSAIKSLFTFAQKTGYLPFNAGAALRLPKRKDVLGERILSETAVLRLLYLESNPRNHALLRLTYGAGLRASEVCALCWKDLQERGGIQDVGGQVVVFGKGGKTRVVLVKQDTWQELQALRGAAGPNDPIFRSRKGAHLTASQLWRIIKAAAARAGLPPQVSTRLYRWKKAGIWDRLFAAVQEQADAVGDLDWETHHVDATVIRAHQHAAGAKKGTQKRKPSVGAKAASVPKSMSASRAMASPSPSCSRQGSAMRRPPS